MKLNGLFAEERQTDRQTETDRERLMRMSLACRRLLSSLFQRNGSTTAELRICWSCWKYGLVERPMEKDDLPAMEDTETLKVLQIRWSAVCLMPLQAKR